MASDAEHGDEGEGASSPSALERASIVVLGSRMADLHVALWLEATYVRWVEAGYAGAARYPDRASWLASRNGSFLMVLRGMEERR